jgi:hypothetical protein
MNPWGFLESRGSGEAGLIQGAPPTWSEIKTSLEALRAQPALKDAVSLTSAPLAGRLHWMVTHQDGRSERVDAQGHAVAPSSGDLADAAARLAVPSASPSRACSPRRMPITSTGAMVSFCQFIAWS